MGSKSDVGYFLRGNCLLQLCTRLVAHGPKLGRKALGVIQIPCLKPEAHDCHECGGGKSAGYALPEPVADGKIAHAETP